MNQTEPADTIKLLPDYLVSFKSLLESDDLFTLLQKLGVAILIGLLIGLEREYSKSQNEKIFAGVRTFPLISTFGFLAGMISAFTSYWVFIFLFSGFSVLVVTAYVFSAKEGGRGGTSEISAILVFLLGSLVFWNFIILAAVIAVIVALILSTKFQLHTFVGKISMDDIYATIKLGIITVIILPLLPDETVGPLDILNPRLIWYMVIFITGISFIGYVLIKIFGKDKGIPLTALMGGLVSSTAVAVSMSRKSKSNVSLSDEFANGIIIASAVMYLRVLIVTSVLNISLLSNLWLPVLIFTAAGFAISYFFYKKGSEKKTDSIELKNPFKLKSAVLFGLVFAIVIFASKAAQVYIGTGGIFAASALAGLTSVDAIVLALAKLSGENLSERIAVAAILVATISNNIVKAAIAYFAGSEELRKNTLLGLGVLVLVSVLYLVIFLII
jgi:uncharacterized membrane protein (DUF4010 family)